MKLTQCLSHAGVMVLYLGMLFSIAGCASGGLTRNSSKPDLLAKPKQILVYDFAASPEEAGRLYRVVSGLERLNTNASRTKEELEIGHQAAEALLKYLCAEIQALGIPTVHGTTNSIVNSETLQVKGQFLSIRKGGLTNQVAIGLETGTSEVRTAAQVYGVIQGQRQLVYDLGIDAISRPGSNTTETVTGSGHPAISAVFSSHLMVGSEAFSETIDTNAERTAKVIANQLKGFYRTQGWIEK